jgi:PleD family two-component response regulator
MLIEPIHILLADDDIDDSLLFEEALNELLLPTRLTLMNDGEQLMFHLANNATELPQVIFLDLNLPRKNGFECLTEIKESQRLKHLRVIIYSTSAEPDYVNLLFENGAYHYIRKPAEFSQLKRVLEQALQMIDRKDILQPAKEKFIITGDS